MNFRILALAAALCSLVFSGPANAGLHWSWAFGDAPAVVGPTDKVYVPATIFNDATSTEHFAYRGAQVSGEFGLIGYGLDFGRDIAFPWTSFDAEMRGLDLAPGESYTFTFATLSPIGVVAPGIYGLVHGTETGWFATGVSMCGGIVGGVPFCEGVFTQVSNDFLFEVRSAVPEPSTVSLMLVALGLMATTIKRRRK